MVCPMPTRPPAHHEALLQVGVQIQTRHHKFTSIRCCAGVDCRTSLVAIPRNPRTACSIDAGSEPRTGGHQAPLSSELTRGAEVEGSKPRRSAVPPAAACRLQLSRRAPLPAAACRRLAVQPPAAAAACSTPGRDEKLRRAAADDCIYQGVMVWL